MTHPRLTELALERLACAVKRERDLVAEHLAAVKETCRQIVYAHEAGASAEEIGACLPYTEHKTEVAEFLLKAQLAKRAAGESPWPPAAGQSGE